MALVRKDYRGLRCPVPSLRLNTLFAADELIPGDVLEVIGDCPSFEADIRQVCARWRKPVLKMSAEGPLKIVTIKV